jgi:1-phosphatidylinositol-3-phosphate 5-kinase
MPALQGQIFCSRCASSIIDGARFGHDGMIRVCNICVERLGKDDPDEEDDHRSIASTNSPFPAHQLSSESIYFGLGHHPQSPFAAAQLFGRTDEPFNLYSIAETKRPPSSLDGSRPGSHPITPGDMLSSPKSSWEPIYEISAPFRRGLSDEEKDPVTLSTSFTHDDLPPTTRAKTPIDFPVTVPISVEVLTTSSIQFPISSPEHHHGPDSPRPASRHRSRFNSYGDFDVATPFIRSRVQSRLENIVAGEPGWRTRRESTA